MQYKLAIGNVIAVKVKGTTRDDNAVDRPFEFILVCKRVDNEELHKILTRPENRVTAQEFFEKYATNWRGQNLVTDEEGRVAEFSLDALQVLFSIAGMATACWTAYLEQVVAVSKN